MRSLKFNNKRASLKDGDVTITPRARYVCYNKTRHPGKCNGQTGYTVKKLHIIIETIAHRLFEQLTDVPKYSTHYSCMKIRYDQ